MKAKQLLLLSALAAALPAGAYETPTMGWSSWNTYRVNISDALIRKQADAMKSRGLQDVGYRYINIDDGFFGGRDADGNLLIHPTRFPNGLKPVVDYIHSLGFKAGIYSDAGSNTCGNYWDKDAAGRGVGFYGHDQQDADFYFKDLGFDFIKIDFCGGDPNQNSDELDLDERTRYTAIRRAIDNTGRTDVRVNVCRWAYPGTWVYSIGSSWRISADIQANWGSVKRILGKNRYLSAYAKEGHFNDMDMLEIGRGLSQAEERTHFGMWCIQSSPLLIGCDMTTIPAASLALLKNKELIALNQDTLALQAYVVKAESGVYIYVKDVETLRGKTRAVAVLNTTDQARTVRLNLADVDLAGRTAVRDLFTQKDLNDIVSGSMSVSVGAHDTQIFKLTAAERLERTTYEAETAWLDRYQDIGMNQNLGYANYSEVATCSGGGKVGWLGYTPENYLEWRDVYSQEGGAYDMTVSYVTNQSRAIYYSVNNSSGTKVDCPAGTMSTPKSVTVRVVLKPGRNTVRLYHAQSGQWCPDIDKMTLSPVEIGTGLAAVQAPADNAPAGIKIFADGKPIVIPSSRATTVSIWNAAGVKLRTLRLTKGSNTVEGLPRGVYYVLTDN